MPKDRRFTRTPIALQEYHIATVNDLATDLGQQILTAKEHVVTLRADGITTHIRTATQLDSLCRSDFAFIDGVKGNLSHPRGLFAIEHVAAPDHEHGKYAW